MQFVLIINTGSTINNYEQTSYNENMIDRVNE